MTTKHTPGPWFYRRGDEWSHSVVTHHGELPGGEPNCWAIAGINKRREPEHEANARLIAAAPDLLEALEYALPYLRACVPNPRSSYDAQGNLDVNCVDRAIAAIAKATGASL